MTNNNQTYERPSLEVLLVEAEAGFANSVNGNSIKDFYYDDEDEGLGC